MLWSTATGGLPGRPPHDPIAALVFAGWNLLATVTQRLWRRALEYAECHGKARFAAKEIEGLHGTQNAP